MMKKNLKMSLGEPIVEKQNFIQLSIFSSYSHIRHYLEKLDNSSRN